MRTIIKLLLVALFVVGCTPPAPVHESSSRANINGSALSAATWVGSGKSNGLTIAANRAGGGNSPITVAFAAMYAGDVTAHAKWGAFCAWVSAVYGLTLA